MSVNYDWKRFWCSVEDEYYINPLGYLINPEIEFSINSHLISNPIELGEHCIIMLGEPGSGKSFELAKLKQELTSTLIEQEDYLHFVDLRSIGNEIHFENRVFNNSIINAWLNGTYNLYIVLDSFDECYLRADVIAGLLLDKIRGYPIERLYLYITCRSGYWPSSLSDQLIELFNTNFILLNLTILRKVDIQNSLDQELVNSTDRSTTDFIEKIESLDGVPFASRPLTLIALIKQYKILGDIRVNKKELYKSYCIYLCGEINPMRRDAGLAISYTPEQKYIVAARFAALSVFSNKSNYWTGEEIYDVLSDAIPISMLRQGNERVSNQQFDVTNDCVLETLACGLFNTVGNTYKWSHWSFMEFLASEYINLKEIPFIQILNLIKNPIDNKIIPSLRGVVGWLCTSNEDIFNRIINQEPETLIISDLALFPDNRKEIIVQAILDDFENSSLELRFWKFARFYKNLKHTNLSYQIQSILTNPDISYRTKRFALKVTEKCSLYTLYPLLIEIVIGNIEHIQTRISACHTLEVFSDEMRDQGIDLEDMEQLIPLALSDELLEDSFDLKGTCLIILWPSLINCNELLEHFPEAASGYYGSYYRFLQQHFIEKLPVNNIIDCLVWLRANSQNFPQYSTKKFILEKILLKTLNYSENVEIMEELGQTLSVLITNEYLMRNQPQFLSFRDFLNENEVVRRRLLKIVLHHIPNDPRHLIQLISNILTNQNSLIINEQPRLFELVHREDLLYLVEELRNDSNIGYKEKLAYIIYRILPRDSFNYDLAYTLYRNEQVFEQYFSPWFGPISLDSDEALRMQREYNRECELEERIRQMQREQRPSFIEPSLEVSIENYLNRIEGGELEMWWRLNIKMALQTNSGYYISEYNPNLMTFPGWISSTPGIQERIVNASKRYILEADPHTEDWLERNIIHRPAYAGYRALRLVYEIDLDFINDLVPEVWRKWIPILLVFKFFSNSTENLENEISIQKELLRLAYAHASEELSNTLSAEIELRNNEENLYELDTLDKIDHLYDDNIAETLQSKVLENDIDAQIKGHLIYFLIYHRYEPTINYALDLLSNPIPEQENRRLLTLIAAKAIFFHLANEHWNSFFLKMQENIEWGRDLISIISNAIRFSREILDNINEENLAELFIWIYGQFPMVEDTPFNGMARFFSSRDFISEFRENIISVLESRGNFESVSSLQRIYLEIPTIRDYLSFRILRAQEFARIRTWEPPKPYELFKLFQNPNARLILSGDQFLNVLKESLIRLENKLQGRGGYIPASLNLWHYRGDRRFRPVYEEDFSDYLKNHFLDDLTSDIIIHREVVIDPSSRTDIFINLINNEANLEENRIISVIIEVKGSWHNELDTAMETQLYE